MANVPMVVAPYQTVVLGLPGERAIPADKNQSDIVKFAMRSDTTFQDVMHCIQQVLTELQLVVTS